MCVLIFCFVFLAFYHHQLNTLVFTFTTIKIVSLTLIFSLDTVPGLSWSQPLLRVLLLLSAFTFSLQDHSDKGKLLPLCPQHQKGGLGPDLLYEYWREYVPHMDVLLGLHITYPTNRLSEVEPKPTGYVGSPPAS